jgi:imidazoleglycerol-phosphate dehydratase/histidinol-phosphatase
MIRSFENEGIVFDAVLVDRSFPADQAPTRKPRTGMLKPYLQGDYDLKNSFVIGDRQTDVELARNLGAKAILFAPVGAVQENNSFTPDRLASWQAASWDEVYQIVSRDVRTAKVVRKTAETTIRVELNLDGTGQFEIATGLGFFDHMVSQLARHSGCDLTVITEGDLMVDEHHTIEDTALALGEAFHIALGSKRGMERYGFALPMDDCMAQVLIDFGGRPWLVWDAEFHREKIGEMPTEMFLHFFKSFSDTARCNLNVKAEGSNEHHKIEAIFKALARAIKMAVKRDVFNSTLPTTKGTL